MKKTLLFLIGTIVSFCCFSQQFPFPMNAQGYKYSYGILPSNVDNEKIQSKFSTWNKNMYIESADGQLGRIRFDDKKYTVSEGIGYGMLIYVYMANETNDFCQDHFDKLYAYYKKWSNGNGVMNWKIEGFEKVNGYNGATDADLDVALALCLAAKQWGYSSNFSYADEAETLLNAIYNKEVGTHTVDGDLLTLINPGDSWVSIANPCYFTIASVGVYDQTQKYFSFSKQNDWKKVYDDSHIFLQKSQRNGLWPNWSNWDGTPCNRGSYDPSSMDFGWDACRTPWRVGMDYLWYGTESSKAMLQNTLTMMEARNMLDAPVRAGFYSNLDAEDPADLVFEGNGGMSAFIGSYACALMIDESKKESLDLYYNRLKNNLESPYYSPTLQVLYLLTISGNAANFYVLEECAPQIIVNPIISSVATDGTTIEIACTKEMKESVTDFSDFTLYVDGQEQESPFLSMTISGSTISLALNELAITEKTVLALSYSGTEITSKQGGILGGVVKFPVTNDVYVVGGNTTLADCENGANTTLGGGWYSYSDGSTQSYKMVEGGANETGTAVYFTYENVKSYVGVGFNVLPSENPLNCSGSTGITFYHKGDACILEAKSVTKRNANYSYQTYAIEAHEDWTLVDLTWETIAEDFVTSGYVTEVTGFQWKEVTGSGSFSIDEVTLIGRSIATSVMDRVFLEAALVEANTLYSKSSTEKYPQTAIDALVDAISAAADVNMANTASRDEIDTATAVLNTAIAEFKSKAYGDKTSLEKAIKNAQSVLAAAVVGEEVGMYSLESKTVFEKAIEAAQGQYETFGLFPDEIAAAVSELEQAVKDFTASVIKTGLVDESISIAVFPNPCSDVLNIASDEEISTISIYNVSSVVSVMEAHSMEVEVPVSQLPCGVYMVQVCLKNGNMKTQSFVKR
ncbi:MAG: glycosyl hydrolase family 8 [Bacteroidales bacterium]|nr:glycosyl hydrolase family 8 [Bacteroidales bacterium]